MSSLLFSIYTLKLHDDVSDTRVVRHFPFGEVMAEVESPFMDGTIEHAALAMLTTLLEEDYFPSDVASYMTTLDIFSMMAALRTTEDVDELGPGDYAFTCKPDGERVWVLLMGSVWVLVRPYLCTEVVAWIPFGGLREYVTKGPMLDCEMLSDGSLILIDVLINERGVAMDRATSIQNMLAKAERLRVEGMMLEGMIIRDYFNSYSNALRYYDAETYPTDGVIALTVKGMYTKKLKSERSLEVDARYSAGNPGLAHIRYSRAVGQLFNGHYSRAQAQGRAQRR